MRSLSGKCWTFADLEAAAFGIASRLHAGAYGKRYGIVMANGPLLTLTILGASCAGTAVPLNPVYQRDEFVRYFQRLNVSCVVIDCDRPEAESAALSLSIPVIQITGDERGDFGLKLHEPNPDDTALVLMTSGSTGEPKLVPLTHRNLCVSAQQVAESVGLSESDVCLSMWELHHIGGLVDLLLAPIISGGLIISTSGFESSLFFRCLHEFRPTWFQAVPTALHDMISVRRKDRLDMKNHSLRFLRSVAAKLPENVQLELEEVFGVPIIQTFGMTEAGPLITSTRLPPATRKHGSVGTTCGNEIRVFGGSGEELPRGQSGEIAIRGHNVFSGYEGEDEENRARFRDGWFLTGDLGWLDEDGYLFLAGRSKQLINRGGEKINPLEVEAVLMSHPSVADAAAFAVEHRTLGEDVAAAVILKQGTNCQAADLKAHASKRLAAFKVPQQILFLDTFPLTGIGKLDRPALTRIATKLHIAPTATAEIDATALELAEIWAREMSLESIGIDENFFVAGGDSLMGVRLLLEVEKWLGVPLPPELMMEISTVRDMVEKLRMHGLQDRNMPSETVSPLVHEMQMVMAAGRLPTMEGALTLKVHPDQHDQDDTPPLCWCFNSPDAEMTRLLEGWNSRTRIIGLYSGSRGRNKELVAEVAEHYFEVIMKLHAGRPFFLGGNCRGGRVIADLLARLLEAGVAPLGVVFMEYPPAELNVKKVPHLVLFGENSIVAEEKQKKWIKFAKKSKGTVRVEKIQGSHREFFRPENVKSIQQAVQRFIQTIPQS